jgi:hypothetical protein
MNRTAKSASRKPRTVATTRIETTGPSRLKAQPPGAFPSFESQAPEAPSPPQQRKGQIRFSPSIRNPLTYNALARTWAAPWRSFLVWAMQFTTPFRSIQDNTFIINPLRSFPGLYINSACVEYFGSWSSGLLPDCDGENARDLFCRPGRSRMAVEW